MASRFLSGLRATTSWWDGVEWRPALLFVDTGLAGAGVKLAERVIKEAGIKLQEDKAYEGAGGGGTLEIVPVETLDEIDCLPCRIDC